jgi:hypothetical protein
MGADMLSAHLFVFYFAILAGLTTFLCAMPDLVNSPMVRILAILVLAGILSRPLWLKPRVAYVKPQPSETGSDEQPWAQEPDNRQITQ